MRVKWTHENRTTLYKRIVEAVGPFETWNGAAYPRGGRYKLEQIYRQFAREMTERGYPTTWRAVQNQVLWGITRQDKTKVNIRHMRTFILNKAAAIQSGLIQPKSLERWFDAAKVFREFIRYISASVESGRLLADDLRSYF